MPRALRIGIDIGGTFTDFVIFELESSTLKTLKILSTPDDPASAVLSGLQLLLEGDPKEISIIHGSTVATNALLERKGALTALVTTAGFRDILQIGRQNRSQLYDFFDEPLPPLVPEKLRLEVTERVDHNGNVLIPLANHQLTDLIPYLKNHNVESVAVCLLFSFAQPSHENQIANSLREANFFVSASSEVLPEFREYERTSTTVVNAYVSPIINRYLTRLDSGINPSSCTPIKIAIMQSNGGVIGVNEAKTSGVRCILSGPAGGVTGSAFLAKQMQIANELDPNAVKIITFDMGGTSTDVSLIDGKSMITTESQIGGCPIRIPMLDIHTIGAGGGSIASVDSGGALRVGPESAGAYPGPACYGLAGNLTKPVLLPTVTDANLILGRILADHFLDGKMKLNRSFSGKAMENICKQLDLTIDRLASGIIEVTNAHMERALRLISVERGYDPKEFTLFAYGGAGGQHAADLARRVGIPRVVIPPMASTLSAFGMLAADIVKDYVKTVMLPGDSDPLYLDSILEPMILQGLREIKVQGIPAEEIHTESSLDVRYKGQSYELTIPFSAEFAEAYHQKHHLVYGYARPEAPLEIVNLRVRATGKVAMPQLPRPLPGTDSPDRALLNLRPVIINDTTENVRTYRGERLMANDRIAGPALIVRPDTTIWVGRTDILQVDVFGNYIIEVNAP